MSLNAFLEKGHYCVVIAFARRMAVQSGPQWWCFFHVVPPLCPKLTEMQTLLFRVRIVFSSVDKSLLTFSRHDFADLGGSEHDSAGPRFIFSGRFCLSASA